MMRFLSRCLFNPSKIYDHKPMRVILLPDMWMCVEPILRVLERISRN